MSPLAELILKAMRVAARAGAVFVAAVIGIELWTHWRNGPVRTADMSFMAVLLLLAAGLVIFSRSITRELNRPPGP